MLVAVFVAGCDMCEHEWSDATCQSPATCKLCGKTEGLPIETNHDLVKTYAVAPTCVKDGVTEGEYCRLCNIVMKKADTIPATGHDLVEFDAVAPTCSKAGRNAGSECSKCGVVIEGGEEIEKLPHTEVVVPGREATCTRKGQTEGKECSICGKIIVHTALTYKLPHDYQNGFCSMCGADGR